MCHGVGCGGSKRKPRKHTGSQSRAEPTVHLRAVDAKPPCPALYGPERPCKKTGQYLIGPQDLDVMN